MKYATYNAENTITGFYDNKIHGDNIPDGAVGITDENWLLACSDGGADWLIDPATGEVSKKPVSEESIIKHQAALERSWFKNELKRADIEVFKAEDLAGAFNAGDWRTYRLALRAGLKSPDFPDSAKRPIAPDAV